MREEGSLEEEEEESYNCDGGKPNHPPFLEQDLLCEDEELVSLFSKEEINDIHSKLESNPFMAGARREAVEWMVRVNAHYSFSALTAVQAVNYFDRFLYGFDFQGDKPWMTQLAAVACLSVAAKMEETQVPLLLDFQVCSIKSYWDFLEMFAFHRPCFLNLFLLMIYLGGRDDVCVRGKDDSEDGGPAAHHASVEDASCDPSFISRLYH